jgi:hypothetical protein
VLREVLYSSSSSRSSSSSKCPNKGAPLALALVLANAP